MKKLTLVMLGEDYHRNKALFKQFLKETGFVWSGDWRNSKFLWVRGQETVVGHFKRNYENDRTEEAVLFLETDFSTYCEFFDFWFKANERRLVVLVGHHGIEQGKEEREEEVIPFALRNWISLSIAPYIRARMGAPKPFSDLMFKDFKKDLLIVLNDKFNNIKWSALEKFMRTEYGMVLTRER